MFKKTLLGAIVAAGSLMSLMPTAANAQYTAIVQTAPPPPLQEDVPAPREGHVWAPGHYEWRGNQYLWVRGHWLPERYGYEYREPRWVQRGNGEWQLIGGDWSPRRDRYAQRGRYSDPDFQRGRGHRFGPNGDLDGDGIANADDRDRDGDGVRNRNDRFPNDPSRY